MQGDYRHINIIFSIALSLAGLVTFLYNTDLLFSPLILIFISLFLIYPVRNETSFIRRLMLLILIMLVLWLLSDLGAILAPFFISFLIAYLLDPTVTKLSKWIFPRWLSSAGIIILLLAIVSAIAIFVFPSMLNQLEAAQKKISQLVTSVSGYIASERFYSFFAQLGFPEETVKQLIQQEFIPKIQNAFSVVLDALLSLLNSMSSVATQVLNAILIPLLSFYFLKDMEKLKKLIVTILEKKNARLMFDLRRINKIFRKYIGWQIVAATIVAVSCSVIFTLFKIPYPIVLGILCGLFNPIPYIGLFMSMLISILTVIIVGPDNLWEQIIVIVAAINGLHIFNAYVLEPNIVGKIMGLNPVMIIASLFVFGGLFGIVGLLIAVPCTAALVMFFNDWKDNYTKEEIIKEGEK